MAAAEIRCTHCGAACGIPPSEGWIRVDCPDCREHIRVYAFPALFRPPLRKPRRAAAEEGEASCFFHPAKRAQTPCDGCGRFLCGLCDMEFAARHFCASCLALARSGKPGSAQGAADLMRERVFLPHNLAWALACYAPLTLMGLYLMPLTAPAALWFSLRHWNRRDGFQIRGRWRAAAAAGVASLQIAFMAMVGAAAALGLREWLRR